MNTDTMKASPDNHHQRGGFQHDVLVHVLPWLLLGLLLPPLLGRLMLLLHLPMLQGYGPPRWLRLLVLLLLRLPLRHPLWLPLRHRQRPLRRRRL